MEVIFFTPTTEYLHRMSNEVLTRLDAVWRVVFCISIEEFTEKLLMPKPCNTLVVICVGNSQELQIIADHSELLINTNIILVLPEGGRQTVALAHKLNPRFFIYADQDFKEIAAVIEKLRRKFDSAGFSENQPHGKVYGI